MVERIQEMEVDSLYCNTRDGVIQETVGLDSMCML